MPEHPAAQQGNCRVTAGTVLTADECLESLRARADKKQAEEEAKEKRKKAREEKKVEKERQQELSGHKSKAARKRKREDSDTEIDTEEEEEEEDARCSISLSSSTSTCVASSSSSFPARRSSRMKKPKRTDSQINIQPLRDAESENGQSNEKLSSSCSSDSSNSATDKMDCEPCSCATSSADEQLWKCAICGETEKKEREEDDDEEEEVDEEKLQMVECDVCKKHYHRGCVHMSAEAFAHLGDWSCQSCAVVTQVSAQRP